MSVRSVISCTLLLVASTTATAQDRIQWKFSTGDTLNYKILQKMDTSTKLGQQIIKQSVLQEIQMSWKTVGNGASSTVIEQVFDRVKLKMEGGAAGEVSFDSAKPQETDNPVIAAMAKSFSSIVGEKFQLNMRPTGAVTDVKIPKKLLDAVQDSQAGREGVLTEQMLKDMMKKSAVMLPENAVSVGDKWKTNQDVDMPFGKMSINSVMTYQKKEDGIATINFTPTVTIKPREGIPVTVELSSAAGRGQILFDLNKGVVSTSQLVLKLELNITTNGQKIPQVILNETLMKLSN